MKDIHDTFEPETEHECWLAWKCLAGLPNDATIGTARDMVSHVIRIQRLNHPLR